MKNHFNEKKYINKFDTACTSIADYLQSKGWVNLIDGTFFWVDPITSAAYPTCEAFIIQSYNDLREKIGK